MTPALTPAEIARLKIFAEEIRIATLEAIGAFGEGHIGGALSMADMLAVLYGRVMRIDPQNPQDPERDKLVLSKGHCGPGLYAALALRGYFPREELRTLNRFGTRLPSHCDMNRTPGIDMSTGSLGQGASTACGLALADKLAGRGAHTYLILGDGECNEGQVWEMAMFAAHQQVTGLIALVDRNHQQLDGLTEEIGGDADLAKAFRSFGWHALEIDGNDVEALCGAIDQAKAHHASPTVIICDTIKGKGWDLCECQVPCHYLTISAEQLQAAIAGCQARIDGLRAAAERA